jgi:hypothetical protein
MAVEKKLSVTDLDGIAFYNPARDAPIIELAAFPQAKAALVEIPQFGERFGEGQANRIALQFVYSYFRRLKEVNYDQNLFDALWLDLVAEIQEPNWLIRGVANLKFFNGECSVYDLGDGVTIRGRSPDDLHALGFDEAVWSRISEDWSGFGASSYVLVVEDAFPKQPTNFVDVGSNLAWTKSRRAISALRLSEKGSIGIGRMWVVRPARFNIGLGGLSSIGASVPTLGSDYQWSDNVLQRYSALYPALAQLEKDGSARSPGNLQVALQSYMATYDRWPTYVGAQLVDSVTALEALLGTDVEISFKLSFRIASLLAGSDAERAELFKSLKEFYDARSKLVHGGQLKKKHHQILNRVDELRYIAQRLLRGFVQFAVAPVHGYDKTFFSERLDAALLDGAEREKLRSAFHLV